MIDRIVNILLIDDDELDRKSVLRLLKRNSDYEITAAATAEEGIEQLRNNQYEMLLLDYRLASITGVDVLIKLQELKLLVMPIIMLSGLSDEALMLKCLEMGAQDFLVKSEMTGKSLTRAIRYAKERRNLQQELLAIAKTDPLTGLHNRELFISNLNKIIAKATRHKTIFGIFFIDLDNFKNVNDSLGHSMGDAILISISERLQQSLRKEDLIARIGGDEFAVIIDSVNSLEHLAKIARHLIQSLSPIHHCKNNEITIGISLGISTFPECGVNSEQLIQAADVAMYEVKKAGKNGFQFFDKAMQHYVLKQLKIETELARALDRNELYLNFQPQVDAFNFKVVGVEALLRWNSDKLGLVRPDQFIPIAETTGLIKVIGAWVLLRACQQSENWQNQTKDFEISINVSLAQVKSDEFLYHLKEVLAKTPFLAKQIVLELTESIMLDDAEKMILRLESIHDLGVKIAIDDFGTGYSSLSYLRRLPVDILKIDQTFVSDIGINNEGEAIVKTIIQLAHNLNMRVIAEGVERQGQVDFLVENKCDVLQGYFFSRPKEVESVTQYIRGHC